jgi:hypothetical protein
MSIAGIPVWAIVLVACITAPWLVQHWTVMQARKVEAATNDLLASIDPTLPALVARQQRRAIRTDAASDARGDAGREATPREDRT